MVVLAKESRFPGHKLKKLATGWSMQKAVRRTPGLDWLANPISIHYNPCSTNPFRNKLQFFGNSMVGPEAIPASGLKFGLRALFALVLLAAISLAWYVPYLKSQRIRQAKLQQFEILRLPLQIGKPIEEFPGVPLLADMVVNESHPVAIEHLKILQANRNFIEESSKTAVPPLCNLKIYIFVFDEPVLPGPQEFAVITRNGLIVYVSDISPVW